MLLASPTANLLTDDMLHLVTGGILGYFALIASPNQNPQDKK
jgi:hypothetical protein